MLPVTKTYQGSFEIHGNTAMFARPDSDADSISYPCPTFSAAKGIVEHICGYSAGARIVPLEIAICNPIQYQPFMYNSRFSANIKRGNIESGNASQRRETILVDVVYKIKFEIVYIGDQYLKGNARKYAGINHAHYLIDMFYRRLNSGQPLRPVSLGRSDHVPTYLGRVLTETKPDTSINLEIGSMLRHPFSQNENFDKNSKYAPRFDHNVRIQNGVLAFQDQENFCNA